MDHKVLPPQVFISFRGDETRNNFISHLVDAFKSNGINIFIDKEVNRGENISNLFKRIEESKLALVVFSQRYAESRWCLDEIAKIDECVDLGKLTVVPIFYNVTPNQVRHLEGEFGIHFRHHELENRHEQSKIDSWKKALVSVSNRLGFTADGKSLTETHFIETIVKNVLILLQNIDNEQSSVVKSHDNEVAPSNALKDVELHVHGHGSGPPSHGDGPKQGNH